MPLKLGPYFPFRRDNRKPDGTWDAPDATRDNIKGTSVDHYEPVWPRWRHTPPADAEGEFVSDDPFFDVDEITQAARFYPPGTPLVDKNLDGNPASRQRVGDMPGGNLWRRRLLVGDAQEGETEPTDMQAVQLAGAAPRPLRPTPRAQPATPQTDFTDSDVDLLGRLIFAEAADHFRKPGAYQAVGSTVLNRLKARGFPKTLQGVILGRAPGGAPQFAGTQNAQWRRAANPAALTGENAIAYSAARAVARDLLYGTTDYDLADPTLGGTYFYSVPSTPPPTGGDHPPPGKFFTDGINSGRLRESYKVGQFRFLRDTQP